MEVVGMGAAAVATPVGLDSYSWEISTRDLFFYYLDPGKL